MTLLVARISMVSWEQPSSDSSWSKCSCSVSVGRWSCLIVTSGDSHSPWSQVLTGGLGSWGSWTKNPEEKRLITSGGNGLVPSSAAMEKGELRPEVLVEPELQEGESVMVVQVRIVVLLINYSSVKRQAHE